MTKPSQEHWKGVKRILRYIKGTMNFGITFQAKEKTCILTGYSDADWANDTETRRSTSGYIFQINASTISWCSKKQSCVSTSTTEAEYIALSFATQEAIWLRRLLENVGVKQRESTVIYEDNQGAIQLSRNSKFHNRTKHIDIAFHFVREKVQPRTQALHYFYRDQRQLSIQARKGARSTRNEGSAWQKMQIFVVTYRISCF